MRPAPIQKVYLGDGAYMEVDNLGRVILTAENGVRVTDREPIPFPRRRRALTVNEADIVRYSDRFSARSRKQQARPRRAWRIALWLAAYAALGLALAAIAGYF